MKFIQCIQYYSLEIFTVISLVMMCVAVFLETNMVQNFAILILLTFVLHEWEESHYPGGFSDRFAGVLGLTISEEKWKGTRVYTGILLLAFALVPFFVSQSPMWLLPACILGIFEGIIHVVGIKLMKTEKPYTPGMITAILMFVISAIVIWYLASNLMITGWNVVLSIGIFIICFMIMQYFGMHTIGQRYRDMPKLMKANFARLKAERKS